MQLSELIEDLQNRMEYLGDVEVRIMSQENWPFENEVRGIVLQTEMQDLDEDEETEPKEEMVFIVEGRQICYGNKDAWNNC